MNEDSSRGEGAGSSGGSETELPGGIGSQGSNPGAGVSVGGAAPSGGALSAGGNSGGVAAGGQAESGGTGSGGMSTGGASGAGGASGLGGTGGGSSASGGAGSGGSSGGPGSAGCSAQSRPGTGQYAMNLGGATRGYYLLAPSVSSPVPLVISFHGLGGTGQGQMGNFSPALLGGAVLHVFPDGVSQGGAIGWNDGSNGSPDVEFVRALIAEAKAKHCVDEEQIFAVGFSWGGWMANRVGCALGDEIAGIVSVAGGGPFGGCQGAVKAMIVHGTADGAENVSSGRGSRDKWRSENGCGTATSPSMVSGCVEYGGCSRPLLWCEHNGGHEVPSFIKPGYFNFLTSVEP